MRRIKKILIWLLILCQMAFLFSCAGEGGSETEVQEGGTVTTGTEEDPSNDGAHSHLFTLTDEVAATCAEEGYRRYACDCNMSYKVPLAAAHSYLQITDVSGKYTKRVCSECGDYKIVRNQEYLYNINLENVRSVEAAAKQPPNLEFYVIAGDHVTLESDGEGNYMRIAASNYYVRDLSGVFVSGETFVFSMDIKVEKYATAELLSIVYLDGTKWSYNKGLIRLEANGTLGFFHAGNKALNETVRLSDKGYNNITVVGNLKTCLFDIYVNEKLVRESVKYITPPLATTKVYIRYFDREKDFVAYADNLKLYAAKTPEFIVPTSGIVFAE